MKSILRNVSKTFLVLVVVFQSLQSKGQCTTGGSLGTFTPLITWQTFGVSAGSPAYRSFNAIAGVTYTFSYCQGGGSYGGDPYLTVSNAAPTALTFNDDFCSLGSQIIWTCPSNGAYRLYLSGCCPCSNAPAATLAYRGSSNPFPPAPNDDCVNAATVSVPGTAVGTTTNAATETITIPTCGTATLSEPGVWYTVVGNGNKYGADLCTATGWDSKIFVYSGSCGALTCVTSNDNNGPLCSGTAASATWCSVPTVTYYILVTGNTTSSAFTLATTETVTGAPPTISVTASSPSICPGFPATFTASGAGTYSWSTGSTSPTLAITPTAVTVYTVTGWSAATCGQDTKTVTFGFNPIPTLSVTASTASLCSGNSATLLASGANTYTWTGGAVPVTNGSAFFPPTSATYTVIGTSALGCTNSAQSSISVVLTPSAQPTAAPSLICIGACSSLNATGATSYTWLPGNLNSAGAAVCPTTTTTYTLIKSNANCVDTKTITVIVNQLPSVFALATPSLVCASKPSVISGGGATTFTWQPGNLTGANVTVTPASNTIYTVTASDGTCVNTTTLALNTKPNPTISIVPSSTAICFGQQATLTANGGDTYTWTPSTLSGTTVLVSPPTTTLFTVVGENSVNCTHTVSQVMIVNPNPTVTTVANRTLVCAGGSSTLSAGGAHAYLWNTGSTSSLNVVSPLATSVYTVTGTYTTTGCNDTKTISVSVYTPTLTITGSFSSCVGGTVNLTAAVLAPSGYTWNPGSANPYYFPTIAVSPSVPTVYVVTALSTSNAVTCPVTGTVAVAIYANPTVTAVPERTLICRFETVNIIGGGATTYTWNTNQVGTSVPVSPTVQTNYTVTGTDANGCIGTATLQVKVSPCTSISEQGSNMNAVMIYPNPSNGEFVIEADQAMTLTIINELGQVVRTVTLNDTTFKANVNHLPAGVYFVTGTKGNTKINQKIIVQ